MSCEESSSSSSSSTPAKKSRGEETESAVSRKAHDTFWDCFDEVANENNTSQVQREERNAIACELDFYLKSVRIDRNRDPYSWWEANAKQYPNLTKFAKIYLSAPCSSVYSERLFSEVGLIYEDKRNRLLPLNAEKLEVESYIDGNIIVVLESPPAIRDDNIPSTVSYALNEYYNDLGLLFNDSDDIIDDSNIDPDDTSKKTSALLRNVELSVDNNNCETPEIDKDT
ncbi:hypothetical protein ILUMI_20173 [Ignelater luminosus]|uniref:HAT C-terminal dimerisation domain-containing protein n=1 Tax=Ignelater luminosus TaxID=2038154 RepID=A0A8K0CES1_IGNLU|nr:hypothetical protein ILUMI_20173 [Ignelater luminosus]